MARIRRPSQSLPATQLLQLIWLASPALPVGGFSYSEGLEAAIETGAVHGETDLARWLCDQLTLAQARADLAVAARAIAAWRRGDGQRIRELNDWTRLTRESSELRQQTEQMGRSMLEWLRQRRSDGDTALLASLAPAPTWPVAWALAAARSGAPVREALLAHAFGWAENMVQAAIKAVPLGQTAGQRILQQLSDAIPAAVDAAMALPDSARQAFMPMLAIVSARHETQYSRLFRS
ncbi:MAG: urease accessory protein UreF [Ideonella sp.]|nr:urease accessory protein UreF [Ideonella sp.]